MLDTKILAILERTQYRKNTVVQRLGDLGGQSRVDRKPFHATGLATAAHLATDGIKVIDGSKNQMRAVVVDIMGHIPPSRVVY